MKKSFCLVLFVIFFMLFAIKVNAASTCNKERITELTSLAQNINADYEEYEVERGKEYYPDLEDGETIKEVDFRIRIYNLTKDLNVSLKLNRKSKQEEYFFKDVSEDGILYIDTGYPSEVKNYTISIRSDDDNCQNEVLRKISLTLPIANYFYDFEVCRDNPEYYLCQEYTTVDYYEKISVDSFVKQIEEYVQQKQIQKQKEETFGYRLWVFIKRYLWVFITIIVLGVGVFVYTKYNNKQRSK